MATCKNNKYVGRDVVLEYAIGCGDVLPAANEWKRMGSMRTKEFSAEWDSADATADDSIGSLRENLATFLSLTMSGDGTLTLTGANAANLKEVNKHFINPVATGGQPVMWMRMTFPDLTFIAFMLLSSFSRSAPYDDVATYSMEASATASNFGLLVEDTPDPDAEDVATVEAFPETVALAVGAERQLMAAVAPVGAPSGIQWISSAPEIAKVTQNGVVTGMSAGIATITARSSADSTKNDTIEVTVA